MKLTWKDITIKKFLLINELLQDDSHHQIDQYIRILSIVSGKPAANFEALPLAELRIKIEQVSFLSNPEAIPQKLPKFFLLKGKAFKTCYRISKLTAGQYIDLMNFSKDDVLQNLHKIMATICLPLKWGRVQKYNGDIHAERADFLHEHMTMDVAYPIALFFSRLLIDLMPAMEGFLTDMTEEMETMLPITHSRSTGDGSLPSTL